MTTCSEGARERGEPWVGTAPEATVWLAVEQPGPWGRHALHHSHLPTDVADALAATETRADASGGVSVQLIRRPGAHPDRAANRRRQVFVSCVAPGRRWLVGAELDDIHDLLSLDIGATVDDALQGQPPVWATPVALPVALVCTNGRRDRCCAVRGRVSSADAAAQRPGQVWESSHLGGHRFAPVALVLPLGVVLGEAESSVVVDALDAAAGGRLVTDNMRGTTTGPPPAQVAELALRNDLGLRNVDDVLGATVEQLSTHRWLVHLSTVAGTYQVEVTRHTTEPRPESCGAGAVPAYRYTTHTLG
ncbi:MAG: sucrase ferredoxin [Actinomycetes bacterium]